MGKIIRKSPVVYDPPMFTAEELESRFKRDYEFNKPVSPRSPVQGWENKYIKEGSPGTPPQEKRLVEGMAHRFKGVRTGSIYGSRKAIKRTKG